jgi:hypothetical protein
VRDGVAAAFELAGYVAKGRAGGLTDAPSLLVRREVAFGPELLEEVAALF